ncbi:hypothetical protein CXB51_035379 [Gossypium anomalum]|uniref:Uncharacterized protein n=1 Tax=Gossypium anomalum TaxID=47600 RepID=A0A8J5Y1B0_9ROSI|nr:hypothetical protein CXB51_035379 [Gossypium anomalum]
MADKYANNSCIDGLRGNPTRGYDKGEDRHWIMEEEGASVYEHLTVFKKILSNLEAIEVQYDKEDLGLILLFSLPSSYSTFRDTIFYSRESLTVDEVYDFLTSYDKMKHLVVKIDSQGEGLIVHGRQDQNANDDQDYSDGELLVASVSNSKVSEEWILDSGYTFYMSPNWDWFTTYETVSECVVLMGNNASCKIESVGMIKFKMFDKVVRTLSDVRHGSTVTSDAAVASSSLSDDDITKLCHIRLGYMSENGMAKLSKRGLLDGHGICKLKFCEHCIFGKKKRVRFTRGIRNMKGTLEYIHFDLWGPSRVPSRGGANYMLTFIDDFSRKVWAFFLKQKSDVTIIEKVRCMLSNAKLPKSFWAEAAFTACFLINRSPSVAIEKKTPQEVWSGNLVDYSDLKIFGCPAYAHIDNGKLEPRSIKCVFLGYKVGVKGYKLWCPENRKVVISRDVVFDETAMLPSLSLKDSYNKENQKQVKHQINPESTTEPTPQTSTKI